MESRTEQPRARRDDSSVSPSETTHLGTAPRRGDNLFELDLPEVFAGTAPRPRGQRSGERRCACRPGNSPASAGTTRPAMTVHERDWEQPRARGDNKLDSTLGEVLLGTAPLSAASQFELATNTPRTRG
jgi:hypothetical protein